MQIIRVYWMIFIRNELGKSFAYVDILVTAYANAFYH